MSALLTNEAHAQIIITRPTSPFSRPGVNPYLGYGNNYNNPLFGGIYGLPRGGLGGPTQLGFGGMGVYQTAPTGRGAPAGINQDSPLVTGHPTRFAAYAGYFSNQGGGFSAIPPSTTLPSRIPAFGSTAGPGVAARPNATPPTFGRSSRTPRR